MGITIKPLRNLTNKDGIAINKGGHAHVTSLISRLPLHIVTLGMTARIQNRRWRASGEYSVWPFRRRRDYRAALREPVYLKPQR